MNIEKIRKILDDQYELMWKQHLCDLWTKESGEGQQDQRGNRLVASVPFRRRMLFLWTEYMNSLDCTLITREDIEEDFEGIINDSSRGRVCIRMGMGDLYVLMPRELADKVLVLGGLPDFDDAGVVERQTR